MNASRLCARMARDWERLEEALLGLRFEATGVPVLLNTSFNAAGGAIVERPEDAPWALLTMGLECCVIGDDVAIRSGEQEGVPIQRSCIGEAGEQGRGWGNEEAWFGERVDPDFAGREAHRAALYDASEEASSLASTGSEPAERSPEQRC